MNVITSTFRSRFTQLLSVFALTAALWTPTTVSAAEHELDGIWRGKLEVQPNIFLVVGVTIQGDTITLDSPTQGSWGLPLTDFEISAGEFKFNADNLQASFAGQITGNEIKGTFIQGAKRPLTLTRLTASDLARMSYEGRYGGQLIINGNQQLPLQVNVAVIAGGYYASLDSPAQQSYGIPIDQFSISADNLSFTSPMIQASFTGKKITDEGYEGKFIQGVERPLTLKKLAAGEALSGGPKPKLGDHGGAVAVITPAGTRTKFFANHDASTHYEIGSVTKTMVAYLLAKSLTEGQVSATDTLQSIFGETAPAIRLTQLATHTSGLPRLPKDLFDGANQQDPYAHYDRAKMLAVVADFAGEPKLDDMSSYEYSNLGYGLLGEALAKVHGKSFAQLIQDELFAPFGMTATDVALPSATELTANGSLAQGYDQFGNEVAPWHFQALAGAGAVRSTLVDMSRYVEQLMTRLQEEDAATKLLLEPVFPMSACCSQALGWILQQDQHNQWYAWHNGQTGGYVSFVGFYLDGSRAVVILNNQAYLDMQQAHAILQGTAALDE